MNCETLDTRGLEQERDMWRDLARSRKDAKLVDTIIALEAELVVAREAVLREGDRAEKAEAARLEDNEALNDEVAGSERLAHRLRKAEAALEGLVLRTVDGQPCWCRELRTYTHLLEVTHEHEERCIVASHALHPEAASRGSVMSKQVYCDHCHKLAYEVASASVEIDECVLIERGRRWEFCSVQCLVDWALAYWPGVKVAAVH